MSHPTAAPPSQAHAQRLGPPLEYLTARIGKELAPDVLRAGLDPAEVHDTVKTLLAEVMMHCYHLLSAGNRKALVSYGSTDIRVQWMGPPWDCSLQLSELTRPLIFVSEGQAHSEFMALLRRPPAPDTALLPLHPRWAASLERSIRHLGAVVQLINDSGMPMLDAYQVILEREAATSNTTFSYRMVRGDNQLPIRRKVRPGPIPLA